MKNIIRVLFLLVIFFTNYQLFAESSSANNKHVWINLSTENKAELNESILHKIANKQSSTYAETSLTETQILRLEFRVSNGASRSFVIGFTENATDGYDYGYDGGLIIDHPVDDMGSLLNGQQYVIQAFAPITPDKEIDLVLHASGNFNYTLISTEISNFPKDQDLFLRDNLTGQHFNLRSLKGYNFTSEAGSFTNRFQVIFQNPSTLSNEEFITDEAHIYVNQIENKLYVKSLANRAKQLNITNLLGQTVITYNAVTNQIREWNQYFRFKHRSLYCKYPNRKQSVNR